MAEGRIKKVIGDNGEELYAANSVTVGRRRGTEHTETVLNTKALTDKQYQAAKDYMVALEWRFPEISRQQLQVEDRKEELCDKTKQRIEEACLCMNSTAKQAEKQLPLALKKHVHRWSQSRH